MVIAKKKSYNTFKLAISFAGLSLFFFFSAIGLFSDRPAPEKIVLSLFLLGSTYGLRMCWKGFQKLLSTKPEFELTNEAFILYDNVEYSKIKFADMADCWIFYTPRHNALLGISLKPHAPHPSNANAFHHLLFNLKAPHTNMIFIPLGFADIKPEDLCRLVQQHMRQQKS
jgi:hypothetical protein